MADKRALTIGGTALLAATWLATMLTGTGPLDHALLAAVYAGHRPALRTAAVLVTLFGEWQVLIPVCVAAAAWLVYRGRHRSAVLLLSITLVGRILVELQKWSIHRLRPEDQVHLVPVKSLSFPSAHAANSMMAFLAIAVIVVAPPWRTVAIIVALLASLVVGLSRSMLGVHWPSDVVGGWAFGAAWVLVVLSLAGRVGPPAHREGSKP
jgi:membrane-associated phospholipid phosphatase